MKRSLAEMTPNCYGLSRNTIKNCSEMTVFERQQTQLKFLQQQHHQSCTSDTQCSMTYDQAQKIQASLQTQSLTRGDIGLQNPMMMLDHWFGWPEFGHISMQKEMFRSSSDCENKYSLETSSLTTAPEKEGDHSVATPMSNLEIVKLSLKKRKMDQFPQPKFVTDGVAIDKRIKRCTLDEDSSITPHSTPTTGRTNISKEVSAAEVSMRSSRMSEITKPDYIQVRARRGQATDSHSLAERARREKISQKMRFLQDLVPGCNKITGKMGMLDEIINYVRALQCQVEFLSMKLASVTTAMDFNNGKVLPTEVLVENSPRYHRVTILDARSHANFPLNQRRASALVHDNFLEASGFTPPPTWDADFQAVQGLEFHQ